MWGKKFESILINLLDCPVHCDYNGVANANGGEVFVYASMLSLFGKGANGRTRLSVDFRGTFFVMFLRGEGRKIILKY